MSISGALNSGTLTSGALNSGTLKSGIFGISTVAAGAGVGAGAGAGKVVASLSLKSGLKSPKGLKAGTPSDDLIDFVPVTADTKRSKTQQRMREDKDY
jgi:hypothetical protein